MTEPPSKEKKVTQSPRSSPQDAPRLYLKSYLIEDLLDADQLTTWASMSNRFGERASSKDLTLSWALPHLGVILRSGDQAERRQRLLSKSFAALSPYSPYILNADGHLLISQPDGLWVGDGEEWQFESSHKDSGALLGVVRCPAGEYMIALDTPTQEVTEEDDPHKHVVDPKLYLQVWRRGASKPIALIDWTEASYRRGKPSLGSITCDSQGSIYAALFWGEGQPREIGAGVLHLPHSDQGYLSAEVWETRQGYDGEEALSETPLLPGFMVNRISTDPQNRVFIATNSGLAQVSSQRQVKKLDSTKEVKKEPKPTVSIFGEESGWPTDFINDLSFDQGGRLWIATDRGLEEKLGGRLKLHIRSPASAVTTHPRTGHVWVAFQDRVWYSEGDSIKSWSKVSLRGGFDVGLIRTLLVRSNGGLWMATTTGLFYRPPPAQ